MLALDWRSAHELFGYLVRVLEGAVTEESALLGGTTDEERNWLRYVLALAAARSNHPEKADLLLQPVLLTTGRDNWLHFLALADLTRVQQKNLAEIDDPAARKQYQAQRDRFARQLEKSRSELAQRRNRLASLQAELGQSALEPERKRALLEQMLKIDPNNGDLLVELVFCSAMVADWERALAHARAYLSRDGRENAGRLRIGLLAAEILFNLGREKEALAALNNYLAITRDPWYRMIAASLVTRDKETTLIEKAVESPEYVLTGNVALALRAEGLGDKSGAIAYYREALGSYMDDMLEYGFALERIKRLRHKSQ